MSETLTEMVRQLVELRVEIEQLKSRASLLTRPKRLDQAELVYRDLLHETTRQLIDECGFERAGLVLSQAMNDGGAESL